MTYDKSKTMSFVKTIIKVDLFIEGDVMPTFTLKVIFKVIWKSIRLDGWGKTDVSYTND